MFSLNFPSNFHVKTNKEINFGYSPDHILDDYLVSRNIAKYGFNVKTVFHDMFASYPKNGCPLFFIHEYCVSQEEKVKFLNKYNSFIKNEMYSTNNNFKLKNIINY